MRGAIPAVALSLEEGEAIRRLAEGDPALKLSLSIECESGEMDGGNPVGEIPGKDANAGWIVVGGHFDGHDICEAAVDNGTGIALVMELADLFAPLKGKLATGIRFMGFDAEELGLIGSKAYADGLARENRIDEIRAVLNLDTPCGGTGQTWYLNGHSELAPLAKLVADSEPELLEIVVGSGSTASDHFSFAIHGVPATWAEGATFAGARHQHTAADTFDKSWTKLPVTLSMAAGFCGYLRLLSRAALQRQ